MDDARIPNEAPRIFISYSWTSENHIEWVAELATRLMSDGIDVILDQWSLKHGQDVHDFMEQSVKDPSVKRVLIISDAAYAAKANNRSGGVGKESLIISAKIYADVGQQKFVPLVCERDSDGKPCLPVFLDGRWFIDFSNLDAEAPAYEELIRNIFDRPTRPKPAVGTPPTHLFDGDGTTISSRVKGGRFCTVVESGKGNLVAAFNDFGDAFVTDLEDLRIEYSHDQEACWCRRLTENIAKSKVHRDTFVNAVRSGITLDNHEGFIDLLTALLEQLLAFRSRPQTSGAFFTISEDNYKFILYELFLYVVASGLKARRFNGTRRLLDHRFVAANMENCGRLEAFRYESFNGDASSLDGKCAERGNSRRLSVMADLVHDRADRRDIKFSDLIQADAVCFLASFRSDRYFGWFPRTFVYAHKVGALELFVRAVNEAGLSPLKTLLAIKAPEELLKMFRSEQVASLWRSRELGHQYFNGELFNLDELARAWEKS
jgi:hypothetical protein